MAKRIMFCPRCMNLIRRKDDKCSSCGLSVEKMMKMQEEEEAKKIEAIKEESEGIKAVINDEKKEEESSKEGVISAVVQEESAKQNEDKQYTERTINDFDASTVGKVVYEDKSQPDAPKRHKHKPKKKQDMPQYTVDEDGSYNIDTTDVTYFESIEKSTPSVKKARGDAPKEEKLKWWEIYKWADRMLARRKIMKEVKKASTKLPTGINKTTLGVLCFFFGWMGGHNFYANNFKKGWTVLAFDVIIGIFLSIPVLEQNFSVSVIGGLGFVVFFMWLTDLIAIIMNKYKFRISKEEFISNLNVNTRAKIGKKYIGLDKAVFKAHEQKRLDKINRKKDKKVEKRKAKLEKAKQRREQRLKKDAEK